MVIRVPAYVAALALPALLAVPAAANTTKDEGEKQRIVCKHEAKTGTRFKTKICHTRAQWDAIEEQHKKDAKDLIDKVIVETRRE